MKILRLWLAEFQSQRVRSQGRSCSRKSTKLFWWLQQKLNYNNHGIKINKWYPVNCSVPPPDPRPISPPPTPDWWPNKEPVTRSSRGLLYKRVAMDMMIVIVMCLFLNSLQINLVELFNIMGQDVHIVQVINLSHLKMLYKIIEWYILISTPILWIGLMRMAKEKREILYWWYPSVSKEAFKTV